jgi:hypothetical protein
MVRIHWVIIGFAVGLLLGVLGARMLFAVPAGPEQTVSTPVAAPVVPHHSPVESSAGNTTTAPPAVATAPASANNAPPQQPGQPQAAPDVVGGVPAKPSSLPFAPSIDSGVVQAIDVGEAFAKQIARPSEPGYENLIGDAHRELEREPRDERWAYEMEGELQNSMVSQSSMGEFKVEHVECRSTICEVRLSGRADSQAGLREWSESLRSGSLNNRLFANMSSTMANEQRVDALYIFRRPRKQP